MKYLKLFESLKEIHEICKEYNIKDYTINPDGSIDAESVNFWNKGLSKLPLKFGKVNYNFRCHKNKLTSLEGSPKEVNGDFWCHINKLRSFKGAPNIIRGNFGCGFNNIKTFEYFPSFVKHGFYCESTPIAGIWRLFKDTTKIELLNDFDIFRDEDTDTPGIILDRLNDFLLTIGKDPVEENIYRYKNI